MFETAACAAVIPCLNEAATITEVVRGALRHLPEVVVVDDGSTDETGDLALTAGAQVLRHTRNLGKGAALKTGLQWLHQYGYDWAVTLDGDGQHLTGDLPRFFRCAARTSAPLVIGNRMDQAAKMSWLRRQVNRWMSRQLSIRAGRPLPDTQCGFRLLHLQTWAALSLRTEHFETESESLLALLAAGFPVEFVPIRVAAGGRSSHIHPVVDTLRWLNWWRTCRSVEGNPCQLSRSEMGHKPDTPVSGLSCAKG